MFLPMWCYYGVGVGANIYVVFCSQISAKWAQFHGTNSFDFDCYEYMARLNSTVFRVFQTFLHNFANHSSRTYPMLCWIRVVPHKCNLLSLPNCFQPPPITVTSLQRVVSYLWPFEGERGGGYCWNGATVFHDDAYSKTPRLRTWIFPSYPRQVLIWMVVSTSLGY